MPEKETYEAEARELAKDRDFWKARALAAEGILAARAASRARRDKRRAAKLAAARIRFRCPGDPVPVQPDPKPAGDPGSLGPDASWPLG